jgi:WD40 repeat protein
MDGPCVANISARSKIVKIYEKAHSKMISGMALTSDGKYLITSSWDKNIRVISIEDREIVWNFESADTQPIRSVQITLDDRYLFVCNKFQHVSVLKLGTGEVVKKIGKAHLYLIWSIV